MKKTWKLINSQKGEDMKRIAYIIPFAILIITMVLILGFTYLTAYGQPIVQTQIHTQTKNPLNSPEKGKALYHKIFKIQLVSFMDYRQKYLLQNPDGTAHCLHELFNLNEFIAAEVMKNLSKYATDPQSSIICTKFVSAVREGGREIIPLVMQMPIFQSQQEYEKYKADILKSLNLANNKNELSL
jgi:hypothetical protein